jgi:hypothetical protein
MDAAVSDGAVSAQPTTTVERRARAASATKSAASWPTMTPKRSRGRRADRQIKAARAADDALAWICTGHNAVCDFARALLCLQVAQHPARDRVARG